MSQTPNDSDAASNWLAFQQINRARRAIRDFAVTPVAQAELDAIVTEACLAPSSQGLQPYELHLVTTPDAKDRVAVACNGQRAARTAPCLIAVVVGPAISRQRVEQAVDYYQRSAALSEKSRSYHLKDLRLLTLLHHWLLWPFLSALRFLFAMVSPARSFLPLGPQGLRHFGARSAMLAAQNLMLAASAKGIDSCPMEGFSGPAVAKALHLPYGSTVVLVIAIGYRTASARLDPQWRREPAQMIHNH